jgi:hypothetical protein
MVSKRSDPDLTDKDQKALSVVLKQQDCGEGSGKGRGKAQSVKPFQRPTEELPSYNYYPQTGMGGGPTAAGWGWGAIPYPFYPGYGNMKSWPPAVL